MLSYSDLSPLLQNLVGTVKCSPRYIYIYIYYVGCTCRMYKTSAGLNLTQGAFCTSGLTIQAKPKLEPFELRQSGMSVSTGPSSRRSEQSQVGFWMSRKNNIQISHTEIWYMATYRCCLMENPYLQNSKNGSQCKKSSFQAILDNFH